MTKHFIAIFFAVLVFAILAQPTVAQNRDTGDTISVVATGVGKDQETALKNALRAAVEQAVGVLVDAETLVANDKLLSDQIRTYSAGFVKSHTQIGEPRTEDGMIFVRISAEVKRTDLRDKLERVGIIKIAVNPDKLRFEIFTKEKAKTEGIDMLLDLLEDFPLNIYDISGDLRYDAGTRKVVVDVDVKINMQKYAAFEKEFFEMISSLGGERTGAKTVSVKSIENGIEVGSFTSFPDRGNRNRPLFHFADHLPVFRRAGQESQATFTSYTMPEEVWKMVRPMFDEEQRRMIIKVVDGDENILATSKVGYRESFPRAWYNSNDANTIQFFPWLHTRNRSIVSYSTEMWPATQSYKFAVPLDVSSGARVSAVHISME